MRLMLTCGLALGLVLAGSDAGYAQAPAPAPNQPSLESEIVRLGELLTCTSPTTMTTCGATHQSALRSFQVGEVVGVGATEQREIKNYETFLMQVHLEYKRLKARAQSVEEHRQVTALGQLIHRLLKEADLLQPLNAILRAGYSLADVGDEFSERFNTGAPSAESTGQVFVEFESKHFGDDEGPVDFSFGGTLGLGPTMAIVKPRNSDKIVPAMMNSLVWTLNGRSNFKLQSSSEVSFIARVGQSRLDSMTTKLGEGDAAVVADVIRNDTGKWAWFQEAGGEIRWFDKSRDVVHHTKDTLLPLFSMSAGLRWEGRLRDRGPLADLAESRQRWFLRFGVNLVSVFDMRDDNPKKEPFSLRFSVEHHRARGKSEVPSATRLLIEASADILKLMKPGAKPAAPAQ